VLTCVGVLLLLLACLQEDLENFGYAGQREQHAYDVLHSAAATYVTAANTEITYGYLNRVNSQIIAVGYDLMLQAHGLPPANFSSKARKQVGVWSVLRVTLPPAMACCTCNLTACGCFGHSMRATGLLGWRACTRGTLPG
jgi:hypothetical protein